MELPEYTQDGGLHVVECGPQNPIVDIIAVHGLAANPLYTWIKKVPQEVSNVGATQVGRLNSKGEFEVLWLKHLLPGIVPNARILKYNYDSLWFANAPKENLRSIADRLVRMIHLKREEENCCQRPIIFIGHSFGGVVIEEALIHASRSDKKEYTSIPLQTCGVVFLGTPFRGSAASSWGLTIAKCTSALGFGSNSQLLQTLEKGSERLDLLLTDFTIMAKRVGMKLVCFYELRETKLKLKICGHDLGKKTMVVDKASATIDGYHPISLPVDHSELSKFGSGQEESFLLVSSEIKRLVEWAPDFLRGRDARAMYPSAMQAMQSEERTMNLPQLPRAEGAAYTHRFWEHEDHCLPDTRVELLREIMAWSEDANGAYIFWLNGMAGTGKSTISRTVARSLDNEGRLAASFFFSRGRGDIGHADKFFTTIAAQLASHLPVVRPFVLKAIGQHLDISQQGLSEQWKHLILKSLSSLKDTPTQVAVMVIVIDALDECAKEEDMQLILALLAQASNLSPIRLRVFVTSRPETPILLGFRQMPGEIHQDFILHNIPNVVVSHDISIYFQQKLARVKAEHDGLSTQWPGESTIKLLVQRAAGLFIYAATTYRFIRNNKYNPEERLSIILKENTGATSPTKELDSMYTQILRHSILGESNTDEHEELLERFRKSVGSIVIMFDVMATHDLAALLQMSSRKVQLTLNLLRSLLNVPEIDDQPIRTLHPSFRDFLLSQERCFDRRFWIDERKQHIELFRNCLSLMFKSLQRDMCDLRGPGVLVSELSRDMIQKEVSTDLQYACCYWFDHFRRGNSTREDNNRVLDWLNTHFLHWLEVLSLIGKVSDGLLIMTSLEANLAVNAGTFPELSELAYDAKRFMLENRSMVETAPLQVYYSALLFSPERSLVRRRYKQTVPWIVKEPKVIGEWTPLIQTIEGHSSEVFAVDISPDGKRVASASGDRTARLWDTSTGGSSGVLEGHSNAVSGVVFSPDGKLLASSSYDSTVRLWDTSTGGSCGVLKGHSSGVIAVVFSPDGRLLASASYDKTVRLWDALTNESRGMLEGHSSVVNEVVFSPDGKLIASASNDGTIILWNTSTGGSSGVLKGHTREVRAVVFSPDGKLVASASSDKTVRLWDRATGESRGVLKGHTYDVWAVAFSPDGRLVASASSDKTIRLWDALTGGSRGILEGHSVDVNAVVFSPDGQLVASASGDKTVRLWDTSTGGSLGVLEAHSDWVRVVKFSPDGELLASASRDKTVRLWDILKGGSCGILERHSSEIHTVVFSPDGKLVASISYEKAIRLWDTSTGGSRGVLEGHSFPPLAVVFSPDGKLVASVSNDETVRLWETSIGGSCRKFKGHSSDVNAVVFSPDGKLVVSASSDRTIRLWDTYTGGSRGVLKTNSASIKAVEFSPDGELLACGSDNTVRLWAVTERRLVEKIDTIGPIRRMRFSDDQSQIHTDRGTLTLSTPLGHPRNLLQTRISPTINIFEQSITCETKRLLWLPWDYRPKAFAVHDSCIVMAQASGHISFISFDFTATSLDSPHPLIAERVMGASGKGPKRSRFGG